jgi:hypothetical protein
LIVKIVDRSFKKRFVVCEIVYEKRWFVEHGMTEKYIKTGEIRELDSV